jgi:hypothetical protein
MQATPVQFYPRLVGEEILKSQVFLSDINSSKRVARTWNMMKGVVVTRSQ